MAGSIEDLIGKNKKKSTKPGEETAQEKFEEKMDEIRLKNLENLTRARAQQEGFEDIDLKGFPISPEALVIVPREQSRKLKAIAFLYTGKDLRIGTTDPKNPEIQELVFQANERAHPDDTKVYMISEHSYQL